VIFFAMLRPSVQLPASPGGETLWFELLGNLAGRRLSHSFPTVACRRNQTFST